MIVFKSRGNQGTENLSISHVQHWGPENCSGSPYNLSQSPGVARDRLCTSGYSPAGISS